MGNYFARLRLSRSIVFLLCISLLSCTAPRFDELLDSANSQAAEAGFSSYTLDTQQFTLQVYSKVASPRQPLRIYLEGDGKSWLTRYRPSLNPTSHNPIGLKLALSDRQAKNIIYLARPCHYRPTAVDANCEVKYWTGASYSQAVVSNLSEAIDQLQQRFKVEQVELVGFSGGGALALLLAAQRDDVISVRTVASNLDVAAFIHYHRVSPMRGSLNPVDFTAQLVAIPQLHFSGVDDAVVPATIAESYLSQLGDQRCAKLISLEGVDHFEGWQQRWPQLVQRQPQCD